MKVIRNICEALESILIITKPVGKYIINQWSRILSYTKEWACSISTKKVVSASLSKSTRSILKPHNNRSLPKYHAYHLCYHWTASNLYPKSVNYTNSNISVLVYEILIYSNKSRARNLIFLMKSGLFCYGISLTRKIQTVPPDIPEPCVSEKLYPFRMYKSQL